jgi:hypothetical protein
MQAQERSERVQAESRDHAVDVPVMVLKAANG